MFWKLSAGRSKLTLAGFCGEWELAASHMSSVGLLHVAALCLDSASPFLGSAPDGSWAGSSMAVCWAEAGPGDQEGWSSFLASGWWADMTEHGEQHVLGAAGRQQTLSFCHIPMADQILPNPRCQSWASPTWLQLSARLERELSQWSSKLTLSEPNVGVFGMSLSGTKI